MISFNVNQCVFDLNAKVILILIVGFLCIPSISFSANLLTNPGFETGDKTGWGSAGDVRSGGAHSGAYRLAIAGNSTGYLFADQNVPITGGNTYRMSGWIATTSISTGDYHIQIRWYNSGGEISNSRYKLGITSNDTSGIYFNHSVDLVAPTDAISATIRLQATKSNGTGYFDDISLTDLSAGLSISLPFIDDFSDGTSTNWAVFDDAPAVSSWSSVSGKFVQSNERDVFRDRTNRRAALDGTYHLGTYAYLLNAQLLTDYRVTLDITPIEEPGNSLSDHGYDAGIMFRYQDKDNYYRVSLNTAYGYARFERKVAGVFTTLAVDARGYINEGILIQLDVELIGDLIQIYIDGEARFSAQDNSLSSGGVALYTQDSAQFDNVAITTNSTLPTIVMEKPIAFTAQPGNTLIASAVVMNMPVSGSVVFDVGGSSCDTAIEISPGYFAANCDLLSQGDMNVTATLNDGISNLASDTNLVGISGEFRIAIGDSLTNGVGDSFRGDNISSDGKVIAEQGYVGVLQSLLSSSNPVPQIIFNEGVPGDNSLDVVDLRINSILERYPNANFAQVLIGTNDTGGTLPIPSGLGCSGAGCNGTFKQNVQNLIDVLNVAGITPVIALTPPIFDSVTPLTSVRNVALQAYNSVILTELSNRVIGPDLYTYFLSAAQNRESLYSDDLHFNGYGYKIVAHLWEHYINGGTSLPNRSVLPLVLEDICLRLTVASCESPLLYNQNYMQVGNQYYVDVDYEIVSIPSILNEGIWIQTADADKSNSRDDYLTFTIDRDVDVYVAYDSAATSLPDWMISIGFVDTSVDVNVTNSSAPVLRLYKKTFLYSVDTPLDGSIQLGGNSAVGAAGAAANYLVIVKDLNLN